VSAVPLNQSLDIEFTPQKRDNAFDFGVLAVTTGGKKGAPGGRRDGGVATLPFSCPFDATKAGKRTQSATLSESEQSPDFSG
jgi:hypothetical protein